MENYSKKAYQENRLDLRMKFFAGKKVLIIDELGYMPLDPDAASLFFQLIARRYERHSANYAFRSFQRPACAGEGVCGKRH